MRQRVGVGVVAAVASAALLTGCVSPISGENASAEISFDQELALSGQQLFLDVNVVVSERHSGTPYRIEVLGKTGSAELSALSDRAGEGSFSGEIEIALPAAGLWQTEVRLREPETDQVLLTVSGPEIEVFDEASLGIQPVEQFGTWITDEPMPLTPSIKPQRLMQSLSWDVEILRGDEWEALASLDLESPELPSFGQEDEALHSLRLRASVGDSPFATSEPFELRVASPSTLIREAWNRENAMGTPEELWEEISSATYPGIQNPSSADKAYVIQVYENQGMPRTSVLSETLVKVPEIPLEIEYKGRACSDPNVIESGIEGTHFAYDIVWYLDRLLAYSTFLDGRMYQHRSLCYD